MRNGTAPTRRSDSFVMSETPQTKTAARENRTAVLGCDVIEKCWEKPFLYRVATNPVTGLKLVLNLKQPCLSLP
jgi:hypothetical protein